MLQGEHSAILSTFIKLPLNFFIKIFVLTIFEWSLKTGVTVHRFKCFIMEAKHYEHYVVLYGSFLFAIHVYAIEGHRQQAVKICCEWWEKS